MGVQGVGNAQQVNTPPIDEARVETLCGLLYNDDRRVDYQAAYELCHLGNGTLAAMAVADNCDPPDSATSAQYSLKHLTEPGVAAINCIIASSSETIKQVEMLGNPDASVRESAARELDRYHFAGVVLRVEMLGNPDWRRRTVAAWALGYMGGDRVWNARGELLLALKDPDWHVRFVAAWALGKGYAEQILELASALRDEDDPAVKGLIMMSLSMYGGPGFAQIIEAFKE